MECFNGTHLKRLLEALQIGILIQTSWFKVLKDVEIFVQVEIGITKLKKTHGIICITLTLSPIKNVFSPRNLERFLRPTSRVGRKPGLNFS